MINTQRLLSLYFYGCMRHLRDDVNLDIDELYSLTSLKTRREAKFGLN